MQGRDERLRLGCGEFPVLVMEADSLHPAPSAPNLYLEIYCLWEGWNKGLWNRISGSESCRGSVTCLSFCAFENRGRKAFLNRSKAPSQALPGMDHNLSLRVCGCHLVRARLQQQRDFQVSCVSTATRDAQSILARPRSPDILRKMPQLSFLCQFFS